MIVKKIKYSQKSSNTATPTAFVPLKLSQYYNAAKFDGVLKAHCSRRRVTQAADRESTTHPQLCFTPPERLLTNEIPQGS